MIARNNVKGSVEYNDEHFAEVQTIGIKGIKENLFLSTIQLHREDTDDTPGMLLNIRTTTEVSSSSCTPGSGNAK